MTTGKSEYFTFKASDIDISISEIERLAHLSEDMPSYKEFLETEIKHLNQIATIQGGYVIQPANLNGETICVNDKVFNTGEAITHFLENLNQVALFVCTAGKEVTERANQLNNEGHLIEG